MLGKLLPNKNNQLSVLKLNFMKQRASTKENEKNKVCTILPAAFTTLSSI